MVDLVQLALVVLTSHLFLFLLGGFAASPREDPRQTGWKYPRALGNEQNRAWLDFWQGTASSGQAEVDGWIALLPGRVLQRLEWGREPHALKLAPDYHLSSCRCVQQQACLVIGLVWSGVLGRPALHRQNQEPTSLFTAKWWFPLSGNSEWGPFSAPLWEPCHPFPLGKLSSLHGWEKEADSLSWIRICLIWFSDVSLGLMDTQRRLRNLFHEKAFFTEAENWFCSVICKVMSEAEVLV